MLIRYIASALIVALAVHSADSHAITFAFKDQAGEPLAQVMVTRTKVEKVSVDLSDDGYAPNGVTTPSDTALTRFSNAQGIVYFEDLNDHVTLPSQSPRLC